MRNDHSTPLISAHPVDRRVNLADRAEVGFVAASEMPRTARTQSDLKLEEWLADYLTPLGTKEGQAPTSNAGILKSTVLTHDVKFEVLTSGNINPSWKLINVTTDPTGSLFAASRDRTHDLIFTLGPGDKTGFTSQAAFIADQSQQIGNAVAAAQRAQLPVSPRLFPFIP